ncbi:MAG: hypothetical protein WCT77_09230 [Bacteroidota bacterium]|jgi:hypothetical protein
MKKSILSVALISVFLIAGCGEKAKEMQQAMDMMQKAPEIAKNMEQGTKDAEKRRQERVKKGDTLAIPYTELQKYLPETISGYTAGETEGQTTNITGFSITEVKRNYTKPNTGGNESYIRIEMYDYNQAGQLYEGLTAVWALGISVESTEKSEKTFTPGFSPAVGFQSYNKKSKEASVTIGIAWRFYLTINANNQSSCDYIIGIANSMRLKDLAGK